MHDAQIALFIGLGKNNQDLHLNDLQLKSQGRAFTLSLFSLVVWKHFFAAKSMPLLMNLQHHGKFIRWICEVNFGSVYRMRCNKKDSAASSRSSWYYMVWNLLKKIYMVWIWGVWMKFGHTTSTMLLLSCELASLPLSSPVASWDPLRKIRLIKCAISILLLN